MAGLASVASGIVSALHKKKGDVILIELNERDDSPGMKLAFQFFPESINDSKAVNYSQKAVPGGSLPIYQWSSSGVRSISFTAQFVCDTDLLADANLYGQLNRAGQGRYNVDIRTALLWLRRFMLPRYGAAGDVGVPLAYAPRKAMLWIPNSGIGLAGGAGPGFEDKVVCQMTTCDITYDSFFPSNLPRMATVQLTFEQTPQYQGSVSFPGASDQMDSLVRGDSLGYIPPLTGQDNYRYVFPYSIQTKVK